MVLRKPRNKMSRNMKSKMYRRRRNVKLLKRPITNLYRFKRQGVESFISWKYNATTGLDIGKQGLLFTGSPSQSAVSTLTTNPITGFWDFPASQYFNLNDVQSSTDLTNLYDSYKITGVKLTITYLCNTATVTNNNTLPMISYAPDYDDNAVPTNINTILQKQDVKTKVLLANKPINIFIRPKYQSAILNSAGAFDAGQVRNDGWINSTFPTSIHNGMKYWFHNVYSSSGLQGIVKIVPTYYIACKDPQ